MRQHSDHYQALGIPPEAAPEAIRAAYLRVMREHHPDRHPGVPAAVERARAANAAWEVLGHSARRASYDRLCTPTASSPRQSVTQVAYSAEQRRYRAAFHAATVRVATVVLAVGVAILTALG